MSVGIWTFLDGAPISAVREAAAEVESLGFDTLWFGEYAGRDAFTQAALVLSATSELKVATGIARFDYRNAISAEGASRSLGEAFPGRFVLGLGGHRLGARPVDALREYLEEMDKAELIVPQPSPRPLRLLAALGPKMLDLARERADGVHPYFVPPEHTAASRERLGAGAYVAVEQAVVLEPDPSAARALAREHVGTYVGLAEHHRRNLRRLGFTEADLTDVSDRLVDSLVAIGEEQISARIRAHQDAGADHVCLQVLPQSTTLPVAAWRTLATLL